jgi:hypothetical protein
MQTIIIINYTGAYYVVTNPRTRGNTIAPTNVPTKNTLMAFPARFTYLFVRAMMVGNVADIPSPNKHTPTHMTVSLELNMSSIVAEKVAKLNSIANICF